METKNRTKKGQVEEERKKQNERDRGETKRWRR